MWILLIIIILISTIYSIPKTIKSYRGSELQQTLQTYRASLHQDSPSQKIYYQGDLFFLAPEENGTLILTAIPTEVDYSQGLDGLILQLLSGPTLSNLTQGNITLIPDGTQLIGSSLINKVAYIEFSKELKSANRFGTEGTEFACKQISKTAQSLSYIDYCVILVDGENFYYENKNY